MRGALWILSEGCSWCCCCEMVVWWVWGWALVAVWRVVSSGEGAHAGVPVGVSGRARG